MKDKINVLVTAIGGPTGIGVLKCLAGRENIRLVGVDARQETPCVDLCDKFYLVHKIKEKEYFQEIQKIVADEKIDFLIPTMQDEILLFSKNLMGVATALPISDHYDCLLDKSVLYEFLKNKIPEIVPRYTVAANNRCIPQIKKQVFPKDDLVCVKKINGHGGIGFSILTDNKDRLLSLVNCGGKSIYDLAFYSQLESSEPQMVMEYLTGKEWSVDVFIADGKVNVCVPRLRKRVSNGIVIEGIIEKNDELIELSNKIAVMLVKTGFINLQFIETAKGFYLIDLNARFCGSQIHSFGAGVNFPYLLMTFMLYGVTEKVNVKWNTKMMRYWESKFFYD